MNGFNFSLQLEVLDKKKVPRLLAWAAVCWGASFGPRTPRKHCFIGNMYRWVQMWRSKPVSANIVVAVQLTAQSRWESDSVHFQTSDGYCGMLFELLTDVQRALVAVKA